MKILSLLDMEALLDEPCGEPGCTNHNHPDIHIHQQCHPKQGLAVRYERGSGVINITCMVCGQCVADIGVALA